MGISRWDTISNLFAAALPLPPPERAWFLDEACAGDAELRAELDALLDVADESDRFFADLAADAAAPVLSALDADAAGTAHLGRTYGPYRVTERLGRGGMGVVYRAEDMRLGRTAALKFLPRALTHDDYARARLMNEARAASMLDHPNICSIYGFEETPEGETFIAMACYGGETLAAYISRGPLPLDEAFDIATQIARGLAKAHASGLTHRDLTPRNVMLPEPRSVKILDFGLAEAAGKDQRGPAAGTLSYMPPEQVRGQPLGTTADVWSLGVILYEMVTGRRPFDAPDAAGTVRRIVESEPRPVRVLRPDVPEVLERLIGRMLSKDPAERPCDGAAVLSELEALTDSPTHPGRRRMAVAAILAGLGAISAGAIYLARPEPAPPPESAARIAVLPFASLSSDSNDVYVAAGLHEEILTQLAELDGILVLSRVSVLRYADSEKNPVEIGNELGVAAVVEGRVWRADDRIRVSMRLVDAGTGAQLWMESFDGPIMGGPEVPPELATGIAGALRATHSEVASAGPGDETGAPRLPRDRPATAEPIEERGGPPSDRSAIVDSPPVYNPANGHYYEAVADDLDWYGAQSAAAGRSHLGLRGYLATITSSEENEFIRLNLPDAVAGMYWLGGFQPPGSAEPSGGWRWITGEPFAFTNWTATNPNDYFGEDGIHFTVPAGSGLWNDIDRSSGYKPFVHGYVVEYSIAHDQESG